MLNAVTPQDINAWFTPMAWAFYLLLMLAGTVLYSQWQWARTCKNNIQVLVAQLGGGGEFFLAPKTGGEVSIKNPYTVTTRTWPVNELATIDVLYPGVGFIPAFLQKTIRMAIVNEGDWEPLLNRSPHLRKVASPDMIIALEEIAETAAPATKDAILKQLEGVSTSPTREMIGSPAVLGNLMAEKITELAATIAKDIMNPLTDAVKRLGRQINPTIVYIGIGLTIVVVLFLAYQVLPLVKDVGAIKDALGSLQGLETLKGP